MDHLENDKRFYVYIHKDSTTKQIVYVGSGSGKRCFSIQDRSLEHLANCKMLEKEILMVGMSKDEARKYEGLLLNKIGLNHKLFNKHRKVHDVKIVDYNLLSQYLEYDETSPTFLRWIKQPIKMDGSVLSIIKVGQPAGSICDRTKYSSVKFLGSTMKCHRIIYALCNKTDVPKNLVIDHIDRDRGNNNILNLRLVTFSENNMNSSKYRSNTTGVTGVSWSKSKAGGNWVAHWNVDFKRQTKNFNPRVLYPDLQPEEAKQKAFEDAVAYRKQMEELYYNRPQ